MIRVRNFVESDSYDSNSIYSVIMTSPYVRNLFLAIRAFPCSPWRDPNFLQNLPHHGLWNTFGGKLLQMLLPDIHEDGDLKWGGKNHNDSVHMIR
jgi:hypothetical protein